MDKLRKWVWTAVITVATAAPAAAQQGTVTSGGGRTTTSLSGTGGNLGGGAGQLGGSGGGISGGSGGSSSGSLGSQLQGSQLQGMQAAPKLSPPSGQNTSTLDASNRLAPYFANPYFQGNSLQTNAAPGGFGAPLYTATSGSGGRGGVTGGLGGGRGGGLSSASSQSGIVVPIPTQIAYVARMQFPTPPVAAVRLQTELRGLLDNTNQIANSKAVQIVIDDKNNVFLRGTVKDRDEARLIEGMVRLTPGVGGIVNELTATAPASPER